jgi:hypothetical protein
MPAMFDFLYEKYCNARLAEMRKQLWLSARNFEILKLLSTPPIGIALSATMSTKLKSAEIARRVGRESDHGRRSTQVTIQFGW